MVSRQCVILVGGLGSRLGALTRDLPKPMIDVGGRPFIEYLLYEVARHGFRRIVLLAGHRAHRLLEHFPERFPIGPGIELAITHVVEPAPAGTAGALQHAADVLDEEFMLLNGDSFFDMNYLDLVCRPLHGPWLAKLALRRIGDASRHGVVTLHGSHITHFAERPERSGPGLINAGIYWLHRTILDRITHSPSSLEHDVFPVLAKEKLIFGYPYTGFFIDIGVAQDLARAQHLLPSRLRRGAACLDADILLHNITAFGSTQWSWRHGAKEAVKFLNDAGLLVFLTLAATDAATSIHQQNAASLAERINADLMTFGGHIDAVYGDLFRAGAEPTQPQDQADPLVQPQATLLELAAHWPLSLERSIFVSGKPDQLDAARRAGITCRRVDDTDLARFFESMTTTIRNTAQSGGEIIDETHAGMPE